MEDPVGVWFVIGVLVLLGAASVVIALVRG